MGAREIQLPELQLRCADHDLEVLRHFLLLLLPDRALESCDYGFGLLPLLVFIGQGGLRDFGIKLAQALIRTQLWSVLHLDGQQQVGVLVTGGDPVGGRLGANRQAQHGNSEEIGESANHVVSDLLMC